MRRPKVVIGIDVGGSNTRIGLATKDGYVMHAEKHKSSLVSPRFIEFVAEYRAKHQANYNIIAVSIGFPGLVDANKKWVISVPNHHQFEGKYLKKMEKELNLPVFIGNDVNFLLVHDLHYFGLGNRENVLGFYVGTGFGGAVYLNGRLFTGDHGSAGEIGHIPVLGGTLVCGCGNIGCLETVASGKRLKELHEEYFPGTDLDDIFTDYLETEVIQTFIELIANGIASAIAILDVTSIVLGGGVLTMQDFPHDLLKKLILSKLRSDRTRENLKIYYARAEKEDGISGAAQYAFYEMRNKK
ncbi:MAG: allose kinase [Acholeplasmataceae bacterium]